MDAKTKRKLQEFSEKIHKKESDFALANNLNFIMYVIAIIIAALAVRAFVFEPVRVDGTSMNTTLQDNERMFVEKVSYMFSSPNRGDIIICYYPGYTKTCVKRVIGLPGEKLEIIEGRVYIDGELLDESEYWPEGEFKTSDLSVQLGSDEVFVMGDNRNPGGSNDSRSRAVGPIPLKRIIGRAFCSVWPLDKARFFTKINYK